VEKYCTARQATDSNITRRMLFARWITKATNTHTHLLLSHGHNGYGNSPQCYVTSTLPVLLFNTHIHHRTYYSQSLFPFVRQMKPVHALNFHIRISVSFMPRPSKLSLSFMFFNRNAVKILRPSHARLFDRHQYLVTIRNHATLHYAVVSILLLLPSCQTKILYKIMCKRANRSPFLYFTKSAPVR
jgi:hypothetical protein